MNELRWILIGFGFVLVAGIYLWGRRAKEEEAEAGPIRSRPEPHVAPLAEVTDTAVARRAEGPSAPVMGSMEFERHMDDAADEIVPECAESPPVLAEDSVAAEVLNQDSVRSRLEPTFSDFGRTAELPVKPTAGASAEAPTLSLSDSPQARRIERRKILSLRLSAGQGRIDGARLLAALKAESLEHGKYEVFHRLHEDGASVFSVASMIEPGTFDIAKMAQLQYPGITLFAQLPGPVAGMYALNELVACAKRLQQSLSGTLQDDRGIPLTVHRIERMRQDVREFERPTMTSGRVSPVSHSASP
jgi:cell division protein ZipA